MKLTVFARLAALTFAGAALFGGTALADKHVTATGEPKVLSGTVEIDSRQIAFLVSGKAGGGVLEFDGKEYPFSIAGLGVGGIGVQKINAVGAVYNLDDVSKFPGTYVEARVGATIVNKGKGYLSLSNQHGVIMELRASSAGVALSVGADGMIVTMKK